jgi:hypothetical protein
MSEDYDRIFKKHSLDKVLYSIPPPDFRQYSRLGTGSIHEYTIGFARDIINNNDPITKWIWSKSWDENVMAGNMPSPRLLNLGRIGPALMGSMSIILLFFIARLLFSSRVIAWSTVLIFASQGPVLVSIRRAMQEGPKFLFLALIIICAISILKDLQNIKFRRWLYALLGILSGISLAAKQDIVPMLAAIYISLSFLPVWNRQGLRTVLLNLYYLGVSIIFIYPLFLAFMPVFWAWWPSIIALIGVAITFFQIPLYRSSAPARWYMVIGLVLVIGITMFSPDLWADMKIPADAMIDMRAEMSGGPIGNYTISYFSDPAALSAKVKFFWNNIYSSDVMYFEHNNFDVPPFHKIIDIYENSLLSGRVGSVWADGLVAALVLTGLYAMFRRLNTEDLFTCLLFFVSGILLFILIPVQWQRYTLIMQIPYSLIAGVGVWQVWLWSRNAVNTKWSVKA